VNRAHDVRAALPANGSLGSLLTVLLLLVPPAAIAAPLQDRIPMNVSAQGFWRSPGPSVEAPLSFPRAITFQVDAPTSSWVNVGALEFDIEIPSNAPPDVQVLLHVKDADFFWYQNLLPGRLIPGRKYRWQRHKS